MPPMMTAPTTMASTMPVIQLGTEKYSSVSSPTFHAWNMLPPVAVDTSNVKQKMTPIVRPSPPMPLLSSAFAATHIGPP